MASSATIKKLKDSNNNTIYPVGSTLGIYTSTGKNLDIILGEAIAETSAITTYELNQLHKIGEFTQNNQTFGLYRILMYGEIEEAGYGGILIPKPTLSNDNLYFSNIIFNKINNFVSGTLLSYKLFFNYDTSDMTSNDSKEMSQIKDLTISKNNSN